MLTTRDTSRWWFMGAPPWVTGQIGHFNSQPEPAVPTGVVMLMGMTSPDRGPRVRAGRAGPARVPRRRRRRERCATGRVAPEGRDAPRRRSGRDPSRRAVLDRAPPADRARLAHVLAQPGRLRRARHARMDAAAWVHRRRHRVAGAGTAPRGSGHELRLHERGPPSRARHAAGRSQGRRSRGAPRAGELARVRGGVHSGGRRGRARAAGRRGSAAHWIPAGGRRSRRSATACRSRARGPCRSRSRATP